ncbi:type II secretion system F family protein [Calidifontibacter sp. DB0510]|uniref:Type II secretion system F family protein n=1 Tax=Metallococcus carri TaxID=1656884 RepID=A0A967B197_9MICO|nr:type II secretion system F family protein [Metallococcus carri]NHN56453.1 type II secretion system F family protein [Metallococcus carri]NOP36077.1 type II secretion system F family protein [Calidifontibacter sp. DB2511S]
MTLQLPWVGALCGLLAGTGLLVIWARLPFRRRPGLADRIAPYVADAPPPSKYLATQRNTTSYGMARPALERLGKAVDAVLGGATSVRKRLERSGRAPDVDQFRAEQALWGVLAGVAAACWVGVRAASGGASLVSGVLMILVAIGIGVVARDQMLTRAADRRGRQILTEFPAVAEMLALAVTAGEGAAAALERVARLSKGDLAGELARCLVDARAGATLPDALQGLADRTGLPSVARFVDGVVIAVERGTPLADVMRAQAQDARDASKQQLIEIGGRKELLMMVPVVFLVLPVTVLFAVWPGLSALQLTM